MIKERTKYQNNLINQSKVFTVIIDNIKCTSIHMYIDLKQLSEKGLARLLNLTIKECETLKHAPLIEERNNMGAVTGYFMHISPDNDAALLKKIIIIKSNFIWFSVKQVAAVAKI